MLAFMDWKKNYKGLLVSIIAGLAAIGLETQTPSALNSILLALILGIIVGNFFSLSETIEPGIGYAGSKMLELSILFLAVGINYTEITKLGVTSFVALAAVIGTVLTLTLVMSKKFSCPTYTGILVGFGTAICGSSAIAALSPSLPNKAKEDVAISMAVVNLLGTVGMLGMPVILMQFSLPAADVGYIIGSTLHSVGNVAGAGFTIGKEAGDAAITVKLARVALLTPGLMYMNYLVNRGANPNWKSYFKLPWYLIGFVLVTLLVSLVDIPSDASKQLEYVGKVILTIAMFAIGTKVSIKKLFTAGNRGLRFGLVIFLIQITLVLTVVLL